MVAHSKSVRSISEFDGVARTGIAYQREAACACSAAVYTITCAETFARLQPLGSGAGGSGKDAMVKVDELMHLVALVRAVRGLLEISGSEVGMWRYEAVCHVSWLRYIYIYIYIYIYMILRGYKL